MSKNPRSTTKAPTGQPKGPGNGPTDAQTKAHVQWYEHNDKQACSIREKLQSGVELSVKEQGFLAWWAGYVAANPDPKRAPASSTMVVRRDKDPMA